MIERLKGIVSLKSHYSNNFCSDLEVRERDRLADCQWVDWDWSISFCS